MRVILARHGDTENTDGKLHGATNEPLSSKGRQESYKLAQELKQYNPNKIYTSPVRRAKETAQIISDELGIPIEEAPELECWNNGDLEGKDMKSHMDDVRYYLTHPDEAPPNGESINDFAERFLPFFEEGFRDNARDTVIDLTHGRNILLAKGYIKKGNLAPDFDLNALTNNSATTDHSGYAIATPPSSFRIVTPVAVAHGRS